MSSIQVVILGGSHADDVYSEYKPEEIQDVIDFVMTGDIPGRVNRILKEMNKSSMICQL